MFLVCATAPGGFGTVTVSTPFSKSGLTVSASTLNGEIIVLWKESAARSYA